eukprot:CAMPEP_0205895482 /NCGR_PEP_ID=MMETSP1083-20121108/24418_1 /ASSEMBLY_ACC=CAM_ASM_000430 /TAXON_ID=97485 /ORGANISM="Prymnesium parvum, Strain Texoma1" /LENGTH=173 /DNA_ID=CAMNT_0053260439 /DNA_START=76 /DNA_END=598 /DNA_ORIENTATION=+
MSRWALVSIPKLRSDHPSHKMQARARARWEFAGQEQAFNRWRSRVAARCVLAAALWATQARRRALSCWQEYVNSLLLTKPTAASHTSTPLRAVPSQIVDPETGSAQKKGDSTGSCGSSTRPWSKQGVRTHVRRTLEAQFVMAAELEDGTPFPALEDPLEIGDSRTAPTSPAQL